ncbi:MAG: ribosome recycling factor [Bacteroidetes bacterium]|nr:ribosome recycling factor [Bacteroidota bacterium]
MNEEIAFYLEAAAEGMKHAYDHLELELTKIRAGKVSPDMLSLIRVEYYGTATPLNQLATIKTLDAKTLIITPFDKAMLAEIEKGIFHANIGMTPMNDGELIRIVMPPTTEERRMELVKKAKSHGEDAKVSIRTARKEANEGVRDLVKEHSISEDAEKNAEMDIQDMTNKWSHKVDELMSAKEKEIMTV